MDRQTMATPFGRRMLTLAHVAAQVAARDRPPEAVVHKWRVFRDLCAAKERLGVTDRALAVLNALLSFHLETALTGVDLIVFPSNRQLSLRSNGMAPATLRRHIATLVDCGLVIRRDSPNGKRYARKGRDGEADVRFGFDLSPLVARGREIEALAEEARAEERAMRSARERITLRRRDIGKMIEAGAGQGVPPPEGGSWAAVHARFLQVSASLPRSASLAELTAGEAMFGAIADRISKALEEHVLSLQTSANESQSERHIQNSNPNTLNEEKRVDQDVEGGEVETSPGSGRPASRPFPLSMVLQACPDVVHYAKGGVRSWGDLVSVSDVVRSALGVSPSAWKDARTELGAEEAAVAIACILQRAEAISSPGGYLRVLVERSREGRFSIGPMLLALFRAASGAGRLTG